MFKIFCLLTGDDFTLARNDTPASRRKIELFATSLMVPVILWFVNTILLVHKVLACSLQVAILTAVIVSIIVLLIERAVIMSTGDWKISTFRICLGVIVAFLGSISIDEVVFENDINQQMAITKETAKQDELSKMSFHYKSIVEKKRAIMESLYRDWQRSKDQVSNEMTGGPGSSGHKGKGAIAAVNINMAEAQHKEYENAKNELSGAEKALETENQEASNRINEAYNSHSLLKRIRAMSQLVLNDWSMAIVYWLFTALFFLFEFLVVIIKICSEETNYERKVKAIEKIGSERMSRIVSKDNFFFDPGSIYQTVKNAEAKIKGNSPAIFS